MAQPPDARKVLVLYWYNKDYPWNVSFDQSFQDVLRSAPPGSIEYYAEYLESNRFPEAQQSALLHDYLRKKYRDRQIDVVVANSDASLDFLLRYRNDLFPRSPMVFVATRLPTRDQLATPGGLTGIVNVSTYKETLDLALRMHPDTDQVVVISGTLQHDKRLETSAREELQAYEGRLRITYLTDCSPAELIAATRNLPRRSIVLYVWQQLKDEQGQVLEAPDVLALFAPSTPVPIYGMANPAVGRGIVGGYINTAEASGRRAAEIAVQVANGARIEDIPVESAPSEAIFDWRELGRWGINEGELPPGSIVRFKTRSLWEEYREYVIGALTLIVLQTGLVGWLLLERRRRMKSEVARLQLATIVESSGDAIIGLSLDGKILTWNAGAQSLYGYTADEVVGSAIFVIVPSDRTEEVSQCLSKIAAAERVENLETVRLDKNGARINVSVGVSVIKDAGGRIIAAASISRDISTLKRTELALRENEQELQRLAVNLLNLQDTERRHLARELHDGTAQNLFAISMNLARLQRGTVASSEVVTLLDESSQLCDQALQEIRTLSFLLHPPMLDLAGLVSALKWYVEGFGRRSGIQIDMNSIADVGRLPSDVETALFRVVQEGLANIGRHSGSTTAIIKLEKQDDHIILQITDHGRGMSKLALSDAADGTVSLGVGIPGMRQRLLQFGGTLEIESNERGTVVTAKVPARSRLSDDTHFVGGRSQASA